MHQHQQVTDQEARTAQVTITLNGHTLALFGSSESECQHVQDVAYLLARLVPEQVLEQARQIQQERRY